MGRKMNQYLKKWTLRLMRLLGMVLTLGLLYLVEQSYPIGREMRAVYLVVFLLTAVCRLIQQGQTGTGFMQAVLQVSDRSMLWYEMGGNILLLLVLLYLKLTRPDYFHANMAAMVSMAAMIVGGAGVLLSMVPEKWKRVRRCALLIAIPVVLLYYISGILISGFRQPEVSTEYKESFSVEDYYGEGESGDRAVILEDNGTALEERVRMIANAEESVILSTFDFRDDESGRVILAALYEAAERGVQVQVVVDGVSGFMRMSHNPYFYALSAHPQAELRIYNPINLLTPWALMGRLHDKYIIVDDMAYVLGGRNTFSYFLGDTKGHKNYDRDAFVYNSTGSSESSLYEVRAYFDEIWNLPCTREFAGGDKMAGRTSVVKAAGELGKIYEVYVTEHENVAEETDYEAMTYPVRQIRLLANPTGIYSKEPTLFYALARLMQEAREQVTIHTPYIICNEMMYEEFRNICATVPEVRLMTNSAANNGNPFGAGDYAYYSDRISATGLALYEYEGGVSYHGKSIVIDDELAIVGSFNMDMRSVYLDTELMLVIDSPEVTAQLREILSGYEAESGRVQEDGTRSYPEGVTPQVMTAEKKFKVTVLYSLLRWARKLL